MLKHLILYNYLTGYFFLDVFATIPWDLIFDALYDPEVEAGTNSSIHRLMGKLGRFAKLTRTVRMVRLLRVLKLMQLLRRFMNLFGNNLSELINQLK